MNVIERIESHASTGYTNNASQFLDRLAGFRRGLGLSFDGSSILSASGSRYVDFQIVADVSCLTERPFA